MPDIDLTSGASLDTGGLSISFRPAGLIQGGFAATSATVSAEPDQVTGHTVQTTDASGPVTITGFS